MLTRRMITSTVAVVVGLSFALSACSDEASSTASEASDAGDTPGGAAPDIGASPEVATGDTQTVPATAVVGASGGVLELANGLTLTVPAGALAAEVELGVEWKPDPAGLSATLPEGLEGALGGVVVLTPHGTQFDLPITVSIPTSITDGDFTLLRLEDETATEWTVHGPARLVGSEIQFDVLEFSVYSPLKVANGACPCWNSAVMEAFAAKYPAATTLFINSLGQVQTPTARLFTRNLGGGTCDRKGLTPAYASMSKNISGPEHSACLALLATRFHAQSKATLQVAAFSLALTAGQKLKVELTIGATAPQALTLSDTEQIVWASGLHASNTPVTAKVLENPAGLECTGPTTPLKIGTSNLGVGFTCKKAASCPTVAAGQPAAGSLALVPASKVDVSDTFEGNAVNTSKWDVGTSGSTDHTFVVEGGRLKTSVIVAGSPTIGGVFVEPLNEPWAVSNGPLELNLAFSPPPDLAPMRAAQFSIQVFDEQSQLSFSVAAHGVADAGGDVTLDGTYDVSLQFGQAQDIKSVTLGPTSTVTLKMDPATLVATATVSGPGPSAELKVTMTSLSNYSFILQFQGQLFPTATVPAASWEIDSLVTNLVFDRPAHAVIAAPGLAFGGLDYTFSPVAGSAALWFSAAAPSNEKLTSLSATPVEVSVDPAAPTVIARLMTLTLQGQPAKVTVYSTMTDDAAFAAAVATELANLGGADLKQVARATAFTRQPDGTFKWGLTCP